MTALPWHHRIAAVGGFTAALSFVVLHVLVPSAVDPVQQPVSTYALTQPGTMLFATGTLALAASCLAFAVRGPGLPREGAIRWLLGLSVVALAMVVVFRTDSTVAVTSMDGEIHRYAAGAAFIMLTLAAIAVALQAKVTGMGRWPAVLAVLSVVSLLFNGLNIVAPTLLDGQAWRGIPQRVLLAVQMLFMVLLAMAPRRGRARPLAVPVKESGIVNSAVERQWAFWTQSVVKPSDDEKLWLTGRGGGARRALPSGNGLRSSAVRRE